MKFCIELPDEWRNVVIKFLKDYGMTLEEFVRYEFLVAFVGILDKSSGFCPETLTDNEASRMYKVVSNEVRTLEHMQR